MNSRTASLLLASSLLLHPVVSHGQWIQDGESISAWGTYNQDYPTICSDGAGGVIITWEDARALGFYDIYAQRVSADGVVRWTSNGVPVCTATSNQYAPVIVSDGAGGAIIVWSDSRNGNLDVYAQRVNAAGVPQWAANGVLVCGSANQQYDQVAVSDGAGGAIIVWEDYRSGTSDIYGQRLNASGAAQWTANGVLVCGAANSQAIPQVTSDGAGGAIAVWADTRSGNSDVYAQRVNPSGVPQWTVNGVAISAASGDQLYARLVPDGSGGAVIAWMDSRSGNNDIYAQAVSSTGVVQWTSGGLVICGASGTQSYPVIASDGAAGAIIAWGDFRNGTTYDVYAQRVNSTGAWMWTYNGTAVCTVSGDQRNAAIASDGAGGAIVTWEDTRAASLTQDIYAQRMSPGGAAQWSSGGVPVRVGPNEAYTPVITSDGVGGAVIAWYDAGPARPISSRSASRPPTATGAIPSRRSPPSRTFPTTRAARSRSTGTQAAGTYRLRGRSTTTRSGAPSIRYR